MLLKWFYANSCQITRLFYCSLKLAGLCRELLKKDTIQCYFKTLSDTRPVLIISPDDTEVWGEGVPHPAMKMHF